MRGTLHQEVITIVMMEFSQSFNQEEVYRHPHGAPPVRIASEQSGARLTWLVAHLVHAAVYVQLIRTVQVVSAESADSVVGQKLLRIEHALQQALHAMAASQREQTPVFRARYVPTRDQARQVRAMPQKPRHAA